MTYPEAIQYLEALINYEKIPAWPYKESLKLERLKDFLANIGNPQDNLRCIHIAGTKGKGSTCAFIAYILREAGFKVGFYTSPHLSDFRERIRILSRHLTTSVRSEAKPPRRGPPRQSNQDFEGMITQEELIELVEKLRPAVEEYNRNSPYGPLSFFEAYTALAFVYFKEKKVDFAVLETGLGGRLDATNVVSPLLCAITPISYEHTQKLGNTLGEIATEKAGIIKRYQTPDPRPQLVVISAPQEKEAQAVIRKKCQEVGAKLYEVNKEIFCEFTDAGFKVRGIFGEYNHLKIQLLGKHQLINATVAVGSVEALRYYNINVGMDAIRNGLDNTLWPGRCEAISRNPYIILDGAQNIASSQALKEAIKANFSYRRLILILGISGDKDIKGICHELSDLADEVILTRANNPRASEPEELAKYFNGKAVHITGNVKDARALTYQLTQEGDLALVTGSLFVVGEFRDDQR